VPSEIEIEILCPICTDGYLTPQVMINDGVECHYSVCSHCKSEQADTIQINLNKKNQKEYNMPSEIERLWEMESDDYFSVNYRTSCQCTSEDHSVDFGVCVDVGKDNKDYGQVWFEISVETHIWSDVWDTPAWSRPFRSFWERIKACKKLLFTGVLETESSFLFRGNDQIDEFVDTILDAQNKANKKVSDNE
jgi:hypothetical protein